MWKFENFLQHQKIKISILTVLCFDLFLYLWAEYRSDPIRLWSSLWRILKNMATKNKIMKMKIEKCQK